MNNHRGSVLSLSMEFFGHGHNDGTKKAPVENGVLRNNAAILPGIHANRLTHAHGGFSFSEYAF